MSIEEIPKVTFPVSKEDIPSYARVLIDFIRSREADVDVARLILRNVQEACTHEGAQTGYNERDGSWMNPCPHCGATK